MGLDMYLNARRAIYPWSSRHDRELSKSINDLFPELQRGTDLDDIHGPSAADRCEVIVTIGYWRKANAVHKWFVDNVQGGEDDCSAYHVGRNELTNLKETCERVLGFKHLANELLPTTAGFFFGATNYDENFYQDIDRTIKVIEHALSLSLHWNFEYQASW